MPALYIQQGWNGILKRLLQEIIFDHIFECPSGAQKKLYKWVLGETKTGTHCPDCESRAGKGKTIAEWKAMGKPSCKCKCRLEPQ